MTTIITGDVIGSTKSNDQKIWLEPLRACLGKRGTEPENWEIFRGDSFQIELNPIFQPLWFAIYLKATLKATAERDVRLAIGVGEKTYAAKKITESNGSAFIRSGQLFEKISKSKVTLAVDSGNPDEDEHLNISFRLAQHIMESWTKSSAEAVKVTMENPKANQKELAQILKIGQSSFSERLKRAAYEEITDLVISYDKMI